MNRFIDNWMREVYKRRRKWINRCMLLLLTIAIVSACTSTTTNQNQTDDFQTASTDCRLVQHEMGETEVCGQPQRVASLSPYLLDYMLALGVQPIAHSDAAWNPSIEVYGNPIEQIPYLGQWIETNPIPTGHNDSPSLEALTVAQPDLILGEEYHKRKYTLMTQIAPTLLFNQRRTDGTIDWQHNIKEIALALNREAQAEELLARHSQRISAVREKLASVVAAYRRILVLYFNAQDNSIYLEDHSTAARLFQKIGFEIVSSKNSSVLPEANPGNNGPISIEILPQIEADPVLRQVPAFKEGKVFFVDSYLWSSATRGPLTDELILEALPDLLLSQVGS